MQLGQALSGFSCMGGKLKIPMAQVTPSLFSIFLGTFRGSPTTFPDKYIFGKKTHWSQIEKKNQHIFKTQHLKNVLENLYSSADFREKIFILIINEMK